MKILMIGGSGFLSGRVLGAALEKGHQVTVVTRGHQPLLEAPMLDHLVCDRESEDLVAAASGHQFDAVLDIIAKTPAHARQAIKLAEHCRRLIMISTDYVYDPAHRSLLLKETEARYSEIDD